VVNAIPLRTARGILIGVIPAGSIDVATGEVGIWVTLRFDGVGEASLILPVPVFAFQERLHPPSGRATAAALRWWLMRTARDQLVEERPELASVQLLEGEVCWYIWDTGGRAPFLR
jgi:hypothetical protein